MNNIQSYKKENIDRLKLWLTNMSVTPNAKYFEILVDNIRVVHKTDQVKEFDGYNNWISEDTGLLKVLVYNTKGSHRSQVFEFRTENYVKQANKDEMLEIMAKQNEELLKRIDDAEEYIVKIEAKLDEHKNKKTVFDMETIFAYAKPFLQNPQLQDNLGGFGQLINSIPVKDQSKVEDCEVTFKRKMPDTKEPETNSTKEKSSESSYDYLGLILEAQEKLSESELKKIYELDSILVANPQYIDIVHESLVEKVKLAA